MIFHLLDEPFSTTRGLALSRDVANMMRFDGGAVVCSYSDGSWQFPDERIVVLPKLELLSKPIKGSKMRGWRYLGRRLRRSLIEGLFAPMLRVLHENDIVWCHNWPYVAEGLSRTVHDLDAKLVYHAHNSIAAYARRSLFEALRTDSMIFNSEAMRREALNLFPNLLHTSTVYNGADENLFFPATQRIVTADSRPLILFVGRLVPTKGVHVLIEAIKLLNLRGVHVRCKLFGAPFSDGKSKRSTAYVRALEAKCPSNCTFEGSRSAVDIAREFRDADIVCCPSVWNEPFGLVNIEAMASGVPVVASRVGGIPEIAEAGGIILVQPNSAIELANALQSLVDDQSLRQATGALGYASFQASFRSSKIAEDYRAVADGLRGGV